MEKGTTEDEMVGWHHRLDGHAFEHAPGAGDGQGGLECCSPWGHKESDMTERLTDLEKHCGITTVSPLPKYCVCNKCPFHGSFQVGRYQMEPGLLLEIGCD